MKMYMNPAVFNFKIQKGGGVLSILKSPSMVEPLTDDARRLLKGISEGKKYTISRLRVNFAGMLDESRVGFKRGEISRMLKAKYFIALNQFISNCIVIHLKEAMPVDDKTEIMIDGPEGESGMLTLFFDESQNNADEEIRTADFERFINQRQFYSDIVSLKNNSEIGQTVTLAFTAAGVCSDNESVKVTSERSYKIGDKLYFRKITSTNKKTFIPPILSMLDGDGMTTNVTTCIHVNQFMVDMVEIDQRTVITDRNCNNIVKMQISPGEELDFYVNINQVPLRTSDGSLFTSVPKYSKSMFYDREEVLHELELIKEAEKQLTEIAAEC